MFGGRSIEGGLTGVAMLPLMLGLGFLILDVDETVFDGPFGGSISALVVSAIGSWKVCQTPSLIRLLEV